MAVVTLPSIEGEINESNKNFEEGSLTWFGSTIRALERRDWWKRWQISIASALTEILTTWLWCTVLHRTRTGLTVIFPNIGKGFTVQGIFFVIP
jgi:hypothetical protein